MTRSEPRPINRRAFIQGVSAAGCAVVLSAWVPPDAAASSPQPGSAVVPRRRPGSPLMPTEAPWALDPGNGQVILHDSCQSLAEAGWQVTPVANPGAYITDHGGSVANPMQIDFAPVPEGQYLMQATPLAGIHVSADTMAQQLSLGEGSWRIAFRLSVADMMVPYRLPQSNGLRLWVQCGDAARGGRYFDFSFMPTAEVALILAGGAFESVPVPGGWDGQLHDWLIDFDGAETVRISYDGEEIGVWSYAGSTAALAQGITFYNRTLDGISGTNEMYFDEIAVSAGLDRIVADPADNWTEFWSAPPAADDVFFTDHEHSSGVVDWMTDVPEGRYFIRARQRGSASASLSDSTAVADGAWSITSTLRFPQFAYSGTNLTQKVIVFGWDVVTAGMRYRVGWRPDRSLVAIGPDGTATVLSTDWPDATDFHTWRLERSVDGSLEVLRDGASLGSVPAGEPTTNAAGLRLTAGDPGAYGAVAVWLDHTDIVRGRPVIYDGGTSLDRFWFEPTSTGATATIEDATTAATTGQYKASARQGAEAFVDLRHPIGGDDGQWTVSTVVRFPDFRVSLTDIAADVIVFGWDIVVDGQRYRLGWRPDMSLVAEAADGSHTELAPPSVTTWTDWAETKFHSWRIGRDHSGRAFIHRDGTLVGTLAGVSTTEPDRIRIHVGAAGTTGPVVAMIDSVVVARDIHPVWFTPTIAPIAVHPGADAGGMYAGISVQNADPSWAGDTDYQLRWTVTDESGRVRASGQSRDWTDGVTIRARLIRPGEYTIAATFEGSGRVLASGGRLIRIPHRATVVAPGSRIPRRPPGEDLLVTDLGAVADAAWTRGQVEVGASGTQLDYLRATEGSADIDPGVAVRGWYAVSIGVLNDSEQVRVGIGDVTYLVEPPDGVPGTAPTAVTEWFVTTADLTDRTISVQPVTGKSIAVSYVRLRRLDHREAVLAATSDEGASGRRTIYNNDGTADVVHRLATDADTFRSVSADRYQGTDVGYLCYGMGTTTMVWANSAYAGTLAENYDLTPEQFALMRSADVTVMNVMLDVVTDDQCPLGLVAQQADTFGLPVLASLRMSAFYSPNTAPWLNGPRYPELFPQYRMLAIDGGTPSDPASIYAMSLTYPGYRDLLTNLLVEAATTPGVDGVELDFCRRPRTLGWDPQFLDGYQQRYGVSPRDELSGAGLQRVLAYRAEILNDFIRGVRNALPGKTVGVRVPYGYTYQLGMDLQTWVSEGLIDLLVPSTWTLEDLWEVDDTYPKMVEGTPVKLYGGIEAVLNGQDSNKLSENLAASGVTSAVVSARMTRQQYLVRAAQFYAAGYDGVYIFNNPQGDGSLNRTGDKVAVQKWREFAYPAEIAHSPVRVLS